MITIQLDKQDKTALKELKLNESSTVCNFKPLILKNKKLMSPGTWNGHYYSPIEIQKAFVETKWENKEVRGLFLDHKDLEVSSWVGMVERPHMIGNDLMGDLVILDEPTAIKLAYGAKFGISPKIGGDLRDGAMYNFMYDNFSVVVVPAVKTNYIDNSQEDLAKVTAMEAKRKELGMTVGEFYAIPRDPPSESKLPIFDAAHVRNALARFGQLKNVTDDEKRIAKTKIAKAAKKFGIKIKTEVDTMSEIKDVSTTDILDVVGNEAFSAYSVKYTELHKDAELNDIVKAFKISKLGEEEAEKKEETKEMFAILKALTTEVAGIKAKLEDEKVVETETETSEDDKEVVDAEGTSDTPEEPETVEATEVKPEAEVTDETEEKAEDETTEEVKEEMSKEIVDDKTDVEQVTLNTVETQVQELSQDQLDAVMLRGMLVSQGDTGLAEKIEL